MSARLLLSEVLEAFGETYRAIDIRSAAVREAEGWCNALTILRFTYEEPEGVRERLRELEQRHGKVETGHFRIVLGVRPFSEWNECRAELAAGTLKVDGTDTLLHQPIQWEAVQPAYLDRGSQIAKTSDGQRWPSVEIGIGQNDTAKFNREVVLRDVGALGYQAAYQCISALCEMNVWPNTTYGHDLCLSMPVFAAIEDMRILPTEQRIQVSMKRHHKLANLNTVILFTDGRTWQSRGRVPVSEVPSAETERIIERVSASAEYPELERNDVVEVRLSHPIIGEIDVRSREVSILLPTAERNVLFETLKQFCSEEKLQGALVRPQAFKAGKLKTSAAFELHVAWLLGLFGLPGILLGEYEGLFDAETGVQLGTVDILSFVPKTQSLLLVACTLGAPNEGDFTRIWNVRRILKEDVLAESTCHVVPVIFTGARGHPPYRQVEEGSSMIPIFDLDRVGVLLELLRVGQEERFFEFLLNPELCRLSPPKS